MRFYNTYINSLLKGLQSLKITDNGGNDIDIEEGMDLWCKMTEGIYNSNNTIFFIGNGASSAMASHMSADMCKNGGIKSMAFNDAALLTAVSNDIDYGQSYVVPLKRFSTAGDMLITISSSGNSPNIVNALAAANDKKLKIITLSGMKEDNKSRKYGDLNFYVPLDGYGPVEAAHQALLHCWLDKYLRDRGCGSIE